MEKIISKTIYMMLLFKLVCIGCELTMSILTLELTHGVTLVCICREMEASRTPLSEAEFEEIMNRNRAISSSAISRAVSDASAGNNCINIRHTYETCTYLLWVCLRQQNKNWEPIKT